MARKLWLIFMGVVIVLCVCLSGLSLLGSLVAGLQAANSQSTGLNVLLLLILGLGLLAGSLMAAYAFLMSGHQFAFWTVANPYKKNLCPFCFEEFYIGDCQVVSSFNKTVVLDSAPTGWRKTLHHLMVPTLVGPRYARERAARLCASCGNLLPSNLEFMDNEIIALVGGVLSGKSLYIASLIKQFEKDRVRERIGCIQFRPLNQEVETRYTDEYYKILFEDHHIIGRSTALPAGRFLAPLTYVMDFKRGGRVKRVNLMLFDGAGEDIEDEQKLAQVMRYITHASAIIFMVDPNALPGFVQQLPSHLKPKPDKVGKDPAYVLNSIIDQIQWVKGAIRGTERMNIPIAITLSKSDLFKYVCPPSSPPAFLKAPSYQRGFDRQDFETVNQQVQETIKEFEGVGILQATEAFKDKAYFAVSATGCPDQNDVFPDVRPVRTVDPLLWTLWRLGVIDAI